MTKQRKKKQLNHNHMADVLQKIIADSGLTSRRHAELLIRKGMVKLNGQAAQLGDRANTSKDKITVSGKPLATLPEKTYLKSNKPIGYACSNRIFPGEDNIFQLVKTDIRLFSIGRLDKNSRGLIILTNDGGITQQLSHPRFSHKKVYIIKADKGDRQNISFKDGGKICTALKKGVEIGGGDGVVRAKESQYLENNSFKLVLTEGKKRQIRRMFSALKLRVYDLKRIEFAGIRLDGLEEGAVKPLTDKEINYLKNKK